MVTEFQRFIAILLARCKLGRYNSHSSHSQETRMDDKAKDKVFVPCKQNRNEKEIHRSINYLPREVIFNILLLIPAEVLQEVIRYVCKQWYDIVTDPSFIRAHCQMPTTTSASFLIQSHDKRDMLYCADTYAATKSVKLTNIKLPFPAKIQGSYNGLVLVSDVRDSGNVHLMNPLRKLIVSLPPVVHVVLSVPFRTSYSFAVNSFGQYKVVLISLYHSRCYSCEMSVFTIGVDKTWRRIDLQHLLGIPMTNVVAMVDPPQGRGLFIAGFLYWRSNYSVFLAMDVDTETRYQVSWPTGVDRNVFTSCFISMGTALGLMKEDDNKRAIWKLHKLTDLKSSEWTEIAMIDIGAMVSKVDKWGYLYQHIYPVSLIDGEFCFSFGVSRNSFCRMIYFNLANESFVSFRVMSSPYEAYIYPHVPTFVSPRIRGIPSLDSFN